WFGLDPLPTTSLLTVGAIARPGSERTLCRARNEANYDGSCQWEGGVSAAIITPGGAQQRGQASPGLNRGLGVSPARQAVGDAVRSLLPRAGRLTPARLRAITAGLADRRELWADLVVRDPSVRWYLPLYRSN